MGLLDALRGADLDVRAAVSADTVDGRLPRLLVRPRSTQQVSALMSIATEHDAVTIVRGHGTKLTWGAPAPEAPILLDLSLMNRILDHQPGDLIASAEAGTAVADLQAALSDRRQRLAVDEMVPGTTVGGLVATNVSGPRRVHTGTVRDLLIGVTLVLADGTIAHSGGKVVKNVAGYDLGKLMTGSHGTLAVITEATFRLHPEPAAATWLTSRIAAADLETVLAAACASVVAPSAIEIDCNAKDSATVAILVEGTDAGVAARASAISTMLSAFDLGPDDHDQAKSGLGDAQDWTLRFPFTTGGTQVGLKLTAALGGVVEVCAAAVAHGLHVRGSAGAGVLYAAAPDSFTSAELTTVLGELRPLTARLGGAAVVLDGPRDIRSEVDVWGPVDGLPVMHRLKEQFDPKRLLAPGRFVGGI